MTFGVTYITKERAKQIEEEIFELKTKERKKIAQKIAEARSHGDLSENAEYDAAKEEQGLLEMKISRLEEMLSRAQIIDPSELPNDKVYILSRVKVLNKNNNSEVEFFMVSDSEADFYNKKISVTSPLGKALMGKKIGETAELNAPAGKIIYEILDITR
ncbi:transcription elongation factor GreA [Bacteroidetes/Chlorobi group bacterium ChocPot_Mid]|jgi:transcription elongation factor GreA|nr:MAG: transcription elongation factor GreA [Bacteroidetes/Chlorobi group bacterium ChocPot_Mid]